MRSNTYNEEKAWKEIQSYLPETNQLRDDILPKEVYLKSGDYDIHIDRYIQETPKGVVVLFHGVGGNGRLLEFIALPLWRSGYEVICPDLPLYGLTVYKGKVSYSDWIRCGAAVCDSFRRTGVPLFVFGLSAGGMLAYQVACRIDSVDGILATCLLDQRIKLVTRETASSKMMAVIGKPFLKMSHRLIGNLKLPMKSVCNMKAIVNNEELAEILMRDNLSSGARVSLEFLYGMLNPDIQIEPHDFNKCPVLLVHPAEDRWTAPELSRLFYDKLRVDKKMVMLPGAGHFPIEKAGLTELEIACISFIDNLIGRE